MSRTKKTTKKTVKTEEIDQSESQAVLEPEIDQKLSESPKEEKAPVVQKIELKDACRRFIIGYKEHWFQSIDAYAKKNGFKSPATEQECKDILRGWGVPLTKIK